jgi:3-phenylpropionate/cinnamic acid dioxygenase small subunit
MDALTRHLIEVECGKLALLYAKYSDDGDHAALAALFAEDAAYVRPFQADDPLLGREAIHAMFRDRPPTLVRHIVTNVLVEVIDERRARGTNYLTVLSSDGGAQPPQASSALYVGECEDEYVKTGDGWKFARRAGMIVLHIGGRLPG